jgi:Holliday junction resolvase
MTKINQLPESTVIKSSGLPVNFDLEKLRLSLEKSKASKEVIADILNAIIDMYYDGISTKEIYKKAFSMLRHKERHAAGRYKLKKAIIEMGPTGYPFEKYVAELFRVKGYKVDVGQILPGRCVFHEMDVVAMKPNEKVLVECKYHSDPNRFSDVKIPLYIRSRFEDIDQEYQLNDRSKTQPLVGYIYTNTRFTKDATQYALCQSMNLVSWDFPKDNSLRLQIDESRLYPLTCLTTLTIAEKTKLLEMEVVLVRDICASSQVLHKIGIRNSKRFNDILNEANALCNT